MKSFIEWLQCPRCGARDIGIVRAGENAEKYGDPFEYAVAFIVVAGRAMIKALVADTQFKHKHARSILRTLKDYDPFWERHK